MSLGYGSDLVRYRKRAKRKGRISTKVHVWISLRVWGRYMVLKRYRDKLKVRLSELHDLRIGLSRKLPDFRAGRLLSQRWRSYPTLGQAYWNYTTLGQA